MQENTRSDGALIAGTALLGGAALLAQAQTANAQKAKTKAVSPPLTFNKIDGQGDTKVLNYALALEALEADLYSQALKRLTTGGTNGLGQTITGLGVPASDPVVAYTSRFGVVEAQHRDFLISALGNAAITNRSLAGANFDFGINSLSAAGILDFLIVIENTGVGAYLGAIPFFQTYQYLSVAAAIQGTEARHTAALIAIRNQINNTSVPTAPLYNQGYFNRGIDTPVPPNDVLAAASQYIVLPSNAV